MGLDLITQRPCKVKETLSSPRLLETIRRRNRAMAVFDTLTEAGRTKEQALDFQFVVQVNGPQGVTHQNARVNEELRHAQILEQLAPICEECPVSQGRPYGCIGYVSYPISQQCEVWLISVAEESYKSGPPYSLMIDFILDKKITGDRIAEMRKSGQAFFQYPFPQKVLLSKGLFVKKTLDTNQLLDVMLISGTMQTTHMNYLLMLFGGLLVSDEEPEGKLSKWNGESEKYMYLGLDLPADADNSMRELYGYFQHLFLALANEGLGVEMD